MDNRVSKTRVMSAQKLIGEDEMYIFYYYAILLCSISFDCYLKFFILFKNIVFNFFKFLLHVFDQVKISL